MRSDLSIGVRRGVVEPRNGEPSELELVLLNIWADPEGLLGLASVADWKLRARGVYRP